MNNLLYYFENNDFKGIYGGSLHTSPNLMFMITLVIVWTQQIKSAQIRQYCNVIYHQKIYFNYEFIAFKDPFYLKKVKLL